ncbi:MAG: energy-coupling factor transporter transmembrane protein EcfT [Clostridiales bacterium]|nr:energy-coupling factor transporter transmembrane protein EcfT [Clostridiales bacterium]
MMEQIHVSLEHIMVPLLMSAVNVSEELSAAALCRGLDNPGVHSTLVQVKFSRHDIAVWVITGVLAILALIMKGVGIL